MAARRTERAERPKFLLFERSEFEKFQCSVHGPQAIFCQPSPFRPFWGRQNGHPMVKNVRSTSTRSSERRSGRSSSMHRSAGSLYENNFTPLGLTQKDQNVKAASKPAPGAPSALKSSKAPSLRLVRQRRFLHAPISLRVSRRFQRGRSAQGRDEKTHPDWCHNRSGS